MAAEEHVAHDEAVPPPGEAVHLPGPSYLPVLVAFGISLALVGVVLNWVICGIGAAIAVFCIVRWIGQTRQDISELPLEH